MLLSCVSFIESQKVILGKREANSKQQTEEQKAKSKKSNGGWKGTNGEIGNHFKIYFANNAANGRN